MNRSVTTITRTGLVVALGLGFPWVIHMAGAGQIGKFLLPMFLPIVGGAFFLPLGAAVFAGAATPFLSSVLTGMPPLAPPIAPIMMVELAAMAGTVALVYQKLRANVWVTITGAIIVDRLILAFLAAGLGKMLKLPPAMITWGTLVVGVPGLVLLFIVLPPVVARLKVYSIREQT